jgi:type I restriction enzyme S subunit
MAVWSEVALHALFGVARLDAEYYQPKFRENEALLRSLPRITTLREIEKSMVKGIFDIRAEEYREEGIPFVRISNLRNCLIEPPPAVFISPERHAKEKKSALTRYDLVLSKTALPAASLVQIGECNCSQDTIALRTTRPPDFNFYLAIFLNTSFGLLQMERLFQGNIQSHLSLNETRTIIVPEPDAKTIKDIAAAFQGMMRLRAASDARYAEAEALLLRGLCLDLPDLKQEVTYERAFQEISDAERFDAQYFHPEKQRVLEQLASLKGAPISEYFQHVEEVIAPPATNTGEEVQNYDLTEAIRFFLDDVQPVLTVDLGSNKKRFTKGDIVVSRLRSYLREIAIVEGEGNCVGSTEFIVLRPRDAERVSAELLLVYLRSEPVQRILKWCQDGSQHPRFKDNELLAIKIPDRLLSTQDDIVRLIRAALDAHKESKRLLDKAKSKVEAMILNNKGRFANKIPE